MPDVLSKSTAGWDNGAKEIKIMFGTIGKTLLFTNLLLVCLSGCSHSGLDDSKIIIVHTNDVHCAIENNLDKKGVAIGYESVAGVRKQIQKRYKNVALADAGDHIQGGSVGTLSKGADIIAIMNAMNFTVSTIGNHEFDYGVQRLNELAAMASYPYVSCNYIDALTRKCLFAPYHIESYQTNVGEVHVSFVGITTPESLIKANPVYFQGANGDFLYSFCQDETGELLYSTVQNAIDASREKGADYVILLGHVGQNGVIQRYRSDVITAHISGADAFIDGHSHQEYVQHVKDKTGKPITIAQVGSYNKAVGVMTIDVQAKTIEDEILHSSEEIDQGIHDKIADIESHLDEKLSVKIGHSDYALRARKDDGTWKVRNEESNLANLAADCFTSYFHSDIAIISGGSVRSDVKAGDITYNDALSVFPFDNDTVMIEATGQQIKDCLEMGAKNYPAFSGGFVQPSNLTYVIDSAIPTSVVTNDSGAFVRVDGQYRVKDIKIGGEDIDLTKTYTVSGCNFTLCNGGDGMSMFSSCETKMIGPKDLQLLIAYIKDTLQGEIPAKYGNENGEGRITIL